MNDLVLAGFTEEDAWLICEAAAATGVCADELAAALLRFAEVASSLVDALKELDDIAASAERSAPRRRYQKQIPPKTLGNMKYAAARLPARPACLRKQCGRERRG